MPLAPSSRYGSMRTGARLSAVNISHEAWLHCSLLYFRLLHLSGTRFGASQGRHLHREGAQRSAFAPMVGGPAAHQSNAAESWNWLPPQAQTGWPLASLTRCPLRKRPLAGLRRRGLGRGAIAAPSARGCAQLSRLGSRPMLAPGEGGLGARRDRGCDWVARRVTTPKSSGPRPKAQGSPAAAGASSVNLATP